MRIELANNATYVKQLGIVIIIAKVIYSIILFCAEIPFLANLFVDKDIVNFALVKCNNLSTMLSLLTSCLIIININNCVQRLNHLIIILQFLLLIGIICIILPQNFNKQLILNNYIPIINSLIFIFGLSCFIVAVILFHIITINICNITSITLTLIILTACISFICSYYSLQTILTKYQIDLLFFYNTIFWSSGNIIYVFFTQTLMVAWLYLIQSLLHIRSNSKITFIYNILILLNTVVAISGLLGHVIYNMESPYFKQFYIHYTQYFISIPAIIFALTMLYQIFTIKIYKSIYNYDSIVLPNRSWQQTMLLSQDIVYHGLLSSIMFFLTINITNLLTKSVITYYELAAGISLIFMTISYNITCNKYLINNKFAILQLWLYCISYLLNLIDYLDLNLVKIISKVVFYMITIFTQLWFIIIIYSARVNKLSSS
ncbi:putative membrane protein [Orientia chuto str. Dubai]|uniref:Putative membrane protein n=1 Tax=Orientia chuto str. Dubai TaxID=1359168 RepID=A0A0F3MK26_9RICK|nr:hypothetical protein [Candidatus Orientia mediorientalis]KJV56113.1 putative membrane protein [Orientia chuto str. Dubai]